RVTVSRIFPVTGHAGGGGRQVVERQVRGDRTDQPSGGQDTAIIRSTSQIQQVFYASTLEQLLVVGQDAAVLRTEEDRAGSTDFEAVLDVDVDTISLEALAVDGRRVDFTQQTTFTDDASTGRQRTTFELRVKQCLGGLHDDVVQDDVVVVNANAEVGSRRPHRTEGPVFGRFRLQVGTHGSSAVEVRVVLAAAATRTLTTVSLATHAVDQALGRERGRRIQRTEVRRDEAFAIAGAEQQLIGRGPAGRDRRVGGAAEAAAIVIT